MAYWVFYGDDTAPVLFSTEEKAQRYAKRRGIAHPYVDYSVEELELDAQEVTEDRVLHRVSYVTKPRWTGDHWTCYADFDLMEAPFPYVHYEQGVQNEFAINFMQGNGESWSTWVWSDDRDEALATGKARITNAMTAQGKTPQDDTPMRRADTPFLNAINPFQNRVIQGDYQRPVIDWGDPPAQEAPVVPRREVPAWYVDGNFQRKYEENMRDAKLKLEQEIMHGRGARAVGVVIDEAAYWAGPPPVDDVDGDGRL